jgi:activator of HSP90 ATPase
LLTVNLGRRNGRFKGTSVIIKTIQLTASPDEVFAVLTTSDKFSELSGGAPAQIDAEAGAAFALFGGMIEGRNVECVPGSLLVQAWRPKSWERGTYSLVKFELIEEQGGTKLLLTHSGFPADQAEHLSGGWEQNYLTPLSKHFP